MRSSFRTYIESQPLQKERLLLNVTPEMSFQPEGRHMITYVSWNGKHGSPLLGRIRLPRRPRVSMSVLCYMVQIPVFSSKDKDPLFRFTSLEVLEFDFSTNFEYNSHLKIRIFVVV